MNNRFRYPYFIAGIFVLCFLNPTFSQKDTITVLIRGEFKKGETLLLKYNGKIINHFGYKNDNDSVQIIIDSTQEEFQAMNIQILRKRWNGFEGVYQIFIYDPDRKYIHLYHPKINKKEFFEIFYLDTNESLYPFHCTDNFD